MRSPLNPSQRIATRLKWLDIAPYVSKVAPELHPADFRASGLRQLIQAVQNGKARARFPKYEVTPVIVGADAVPTLRVDFVDGNSVAIDARRKDFDELCRDLEPSLRRIVRSDEQTGTVREGLDWERS
ncbi:hypothetical protein FNF27_04952 [Cafeteria roenbergensis]|uniref:Uncharacterized protein n=1 Tax=Cafeteria roenbergensis TaxID=33653 RepID=A0A5A8C6J7_CAFRO|nr:hypothetical protein FNF31_07344 [Cafeteria roenbergensis]KAA0148880.1 hypothetical protein FNF29_06354 [Cafeteria roenbergensis]KAA0149796.1 hypothetical protein FNF28_07320 [Cafeteria roenbergensis]KAA0173618.1 hypothetical protein FNF27_04952 [Cafeteria roenbergensis]|eukprot:KAA0148880.1 hypothetical protein FNF29_06354 [Cafeteria roenbergensis]